MYTQSFFVSLLAISLSLMVPSALHAREWTDSTGKYKIEAELGSISEDGKIVTLKKSDGKTVEIPRSKLGAKDREYLEEAKDSLNAEKQTYFWELIAKSPDVVDAIRCWSSKVGSRTLKAGFALLSEDGKTAIFQKGNGDIAQLPLVELSKADQDYIKTLLEKRKRYHSEDTQTEPMYGEKELEVPFDPFAESLPPDFRGHDVRQLYQMFSKITNMKKGEFESTEEYEKRRNKALTEPLFGSVLPTSTFAVLDMFLFDPVYDADKEVFRIKDVFSQNNKGNLIVDFSVKKVREYTASNAYGVKVEVTEKEVNSHTLKYTPSLMNITDIEVPIPKDDAEYTKQNIKVLVVFQILPPYSMFDYDHDEPTRDDPEETSYFLRYLYVTQLQFFVFNAETGEIYAKVAMSK